MFYKALFIIKIEFLLLLLSMFNLVSFSQDANFIWDYPVKPGMEQWKIVKEEEKFDVCQVPENILKDIPTKELIELCIRFPLFHRVILFDDLITGYNQIRGKFNGFRELSKRKDLDKEMIRLYYDLNINNKIATFTDKEIRKIVAKAWRMEVLISCEVMSQSIDTNLVNEFLLESYKKYTVKKNHPDIFSSFSYQLPLYIMTKSLAINYGGTFDSLLIADPQLDYFMRSCNLPSLHLEGEIVQMAYQYMNQMKKLP